MNKRLSNLIGKKFHMLTVISFVGMKNKNSLWSCVCDCGGRTDAYGCVLKANKVKSCGCLQRKFQKKVIHGESNTTEYNTWMSMKQRCQNPNIKSYKYYGARGIKFCKEWNEFSVFLKDMGHKPSCRHSIERIDNDGDYCPSNCKWATRLEQNRNTRKTRIIVNIFTGIFYFSLSEAADSIGITSTRMFAQLNGKNKTFMRYA